MKQQSSLLAGLTIAAAAVLPGCEQPAPVDPARPVEEAPTATATAQPSGETEQPKPAREVGSVAPSAKPGAPVSLEYVLRGTPQIGVPLEIDLAFKTGASAEALSVTCSADEALTLSDSAFRLSNAGAGSSSSHTITVTPQVEGYHYVNVIARMGAQARAFAVPVPVGAVGARDALKPQGEIVEDETGQRLIRLPAEED